MSEPEPITLPVDFKKMRPGRRKQVAGLREDQPPALYIHCVSTYNRLLAQARSVTVFEGQNEDGTPHEVEIILWEGMLTRLITGELSLSTPYYTSITRSLKKMGCFRCLKRGGGSSKSQWELLKEPTLEAFLAEGNPPPKTTGATQMEVVQQQLNALNRRLQALEAWKESHA